MIQKVKILKNYSTFELENEINNFIEKFDCNAIVSIKYSTTLDFNNRIMYSCLISYLVK